MYSRLLKKELSDSEIYSLLRKFIPRSFENDHYAEQMVLHLSELTADDVTGVYEDALNDSLNEIYLNDEVNITGTVRNIVRSKYTEPSDLDCYLDLFSEPKLLRNKNTYEEFCSKNSLDHSKLAFFPIEGDSMINAGINDGDTVLVDLSKTPKDSDIAAVSVKMKYYIKRLKISGGSVILVSENQKYPPYTVKFDDEFRIIGTAITTLKKIYKNKVDAK